MSRQIDCRSRHKKTSIFYFFFFEICGSFFFLKKNLIYLFLAVLGLCCCTRAFSSCGERGLLFFKNFIYLFIYLWLCWVFVSMRGLFPVAASGGHSSSRCAGLSLSRPLPLRSTGSRWAGSVVVAHVPSCSTACGIFPDQGSNPCPLHWQADSQPLRHQGSPWQTLLYQSINNW